MSARVSFGIKSFVSCVVFNSMLLVAFYLVLGRFIASFHQWFDPFASGKGAGLPEDIQLAVSSVLQWLGQLEQYLAIAVFGTGALVTLLMWCFILAHGRRLEKATRERQAETRSPAPPAVAEVLRQPVDVPRFEQKAPEAAVQILSILQRQGRFIDFLQEDLTLYDDSQIGAAVRSVHAGCKQALGEHVELKPVYEADEGSQVKVDVGFDAAATRLTGNVSGDPPFTGVLRHRGWRVVHMELPQLTPTQGKKWILAPAEVEIG